MSTQPTTRNRRGRPMSQERQRQRADAYQLWLQCGWSQHRIAKTLGLAQSTVAYWFSTWPFYVKYQEDRRAIYG